jgi:hypothetical protein
MRREVASAVVVLAAAVLLGPGAGCASPGETYTESHRINREWMERLRSALGAGDISPGAGDGVWPVRSTTAVTFAPPFSWRFRIEAPDTARAAAALQMFVYRLQEQVQARGLAFVDERAVNGTIAVVTPLFADERLLTVRLMIVPDGPPIGACCGEQPASWSGTLLAQFAQFERLGSGDFSKVNGRLAEVTALLRLTAFEAARLVSEIRPPPF